LFLDDCCRICNHNGGWFYDWALGILRSKSEQMASNSGYNTGECGSGLASLPRGQSSLLRRPIIMASLPRLNGFVSAFSAWTPEEISFLRRLHPDHTYKEIAAKLGRTERSIRAKCFKLKLAHCGHWTAERFMSFVEKQEAGCWVWTGSRNVQGYGTLAYERRTVTAHRFSYEVCAGLTTINRDLHHTCENRLCVNPDHLQDVTPQEHFLFSRTSCVAINRVKTHCVNGHAFTEENTKIEKNRRGAVRRCWTCLREYSKRRVAKEKASK